MSSDTLKMVDLIARCGTSEMRVRGKNQLVEVGNADMRGAEKWGGAPTQTESNKSD